MKLLKVSNAIALVVALLVVTAPSNAAARTPLRVLVPDADNLQYLSFWVAHGAGYFAEEGIDVELRVPSASALAESAFRSGDAEVAVLSPPMYLRLVAERWPLVLVANLLQNDPINLLVRRSVAVARGLSADQPLADRLRGLHGLKIGVAPGPPSRLRALFQGNGLDADHDLELVIVHGRDQNAAFANHDVDALYSHTPYLENALVDQDAVLLVNQSAGEFAPLAARQIHALVTARAFASAHPDVVRAIVRAVYRAQRLLHADPAASVDAVRNALPSYERAHVETLVHLYAPAIPGTPRVTTAGFAQALAFFPASAEAPDLAGIDLGAYIAPEFAEDAVRALGEPSSRRQPIVLAGVIGAGLLLALVAVRRDRGHARRGRSASV